MSYVATFLGEEGFGTYDVTWGENPTFERVSKASDQYLIPGFVDIHCHGAYGMDFMASSQSDLLALAKKFRKEGYEAFLPTTVTASFDDVKAAISQLPDDPMIPGFHLEGPFISPDYPGAQPEEQIQDFSLSPTPWDEILSHPKLKVITLAPEKPHAIEKILELSKNQVVVSMGHSNATYEEARRGFEFGAIHVTHMFNALRPFHHREASIVGYALNSEALSCELIYDRVHVSKDAASLLLKAKGPHKIIAVSDSTAATRLPPGHRLQMWGHDVIVDTHDVRLASNGALAGSTITLLDAFRNLTEDFGAEFAIRACCLNPRNAIGLPTEPNLYVELNKNLEITGLWLKGREHS